MTCRGCDAVARAGWLRMGFCEHCWRDFPNAIERAVLRRAIRILGDPNDPRWRSESYTGTGMWRW